MALLRESRSRQLLSRGKLTRGRGWVGLGTSLTTHCKCQETDPFHVARDDHSRSHFSSVRTCCHLARIPEGVGRAPTLGVEMGRGLLSPTARGQSGPDSEPGASQAGAAVLSRPPPSAKSQLADPSPRSPPAWCPVCPCPLEVATLLAVRPVLSTLTGVIAFSARGQTRLNGAPPQFAGVQSRV